MVITIERTKGKFVPERNIANKTISIFVQYHGLTQPEDPAENE
jgi:hypothetical protein